MRIVETLTTSDLYDIASTGEIVYTEKERDFLSRYAPFAFFEEPIEKVYENAKMEVGRTTFGSLIKLGVCVSGGTMLEGLIKIKKDELNPLFALEGIEEVSGNGSVLSSLAEFQEKGSEYLDRIALKDNIVGYRKINAIDRFSEQRDIVAQTFGDIPILVFGSVLDCPDPQDIDVSIFPADFDVTYFEKLYKKSFGGNPPISVMIQPQHKFDAAMLFDPYPRFDKGALINGSLEIPIIDKDYFIQLDLVDAACKYVLGRKMLTPEKVNHCDKLVAQVNSRLKISKFVRMNFVSALGVDLEPVQRVAYDHIPSRDVFLDEMVKVNKECLDILEKVYDFF